MSIYEIYLKSSILDRQGFETNVIKVNCTKLSRINDEGSHVFVAFNDDNEIIAYFPINNVIGIKKIS